jgi:transcription initiation factor IIE alpha subunit
MKESQLRQLIREEYSKLNEDRDIKYNELIEELKNVCERYAIRLDPSDIKDALMNVSDMYNDY